MTKPKKNLDALIATLQNIIPLSEPLQEAIHESFEKLTLDKKTALVKIGEYCDSMWFLAEGTARSFVSHEEKVNETTTRIMFPGQIIVSVISYYKGLPAIEDIVTVTPCIVFKISKVDLQSLVMEFEEFKQCVLVLTEDYTCQISRREEMLRLPTVKKRYAFMQEHFEELINFIPVEYAASFANMDRTTFTNVRSGKYKSQENERQNL